jgi:hypothetical protein
MLPISCSKEPNSAKCFVGVEVDQTCEQTGREGGNCFVDFIFKTVDTLNISMLEQSIIMRSKPEVGLQQIGGYRCIRSV